MSATNMESVADTELTDYRYKVTGQDVSDMRELRDLGFSVMQIAEHFCISRATVYYWTSEKIYKNTKKKNAKRRYDAKDHERIQRDLEKRKLNFQETPKSVLRHQYHGRLSDNRKGEDSLLTVQGIPIETVERLNETGALHRGNSKIKHDHS